MTPADLAAAKVAFVGTVVALRDVSGNSYADPAMFAPRLAGPQCTEGVVNGVPTNTPAACTPQVQFTDMRAVVFRVEEPIRGVGVGEFVARQGGGGDCATIFELGVRYVYGYEGELDVLGFWLHPSTDDEYFRVFLSRNGRAWIVPPDMTAREAISRWRTPTPGANWDPLR